MRWVLLAILIYLVVLVQTTLAGVLTFNIGSVGRVGPDLLAILAVYVAMHARGGVDVLLSAWVMGLAIDLTTGAGPVVSTVVGPMALGYVAAAGAIYRLREIVFRDSIVAQCVMAVIFCLIAHGIWVTVQWMLALRSLAWTGYLAMLGQVGLLAVYTAVLMPLGRLGLNRCRRWLIPAGSKLSRRMRR